MRFAFIECLAVVLLGCFVTGEEEHQQSIPKHSVRRKSCRPAITQGARRCRTT